MRTDTTTPDTRLADDPLKFNPASVDSLIELATGGLPTRHHGKLLFSRLRYLDPVRRRAGLPEGVAALVERMTGDETRVTLVNTNAVDARTVLVQGGAYAEHQIVSANLDGKKLAVAGAQVAVRLQPGCGGALVLKMDRFTRTPTLAFPWGE